MTLTSSTTGRDITPSDPDGHPVTDPMSLRVIARTITQAGGRTPIVHTSVPLPPTRWTHPTPPRPKAPTVALAIIAAALAIVAGVALVGAAHLAGRWTLAAAVPLLAVLLWKVDE